MDLTPDRARELFDYDPQTGVIRWKVRLANRVQVGDALRVRKRRSLQACVAGKFYRAQDLAWAITYGEWPREQVQNANGDCTDNRLSNLILPAPKVRGVPMIRAKVKKAPVKEPRVTLTGITGVFFIGGRNPWRAELSAHKKTHYLGLYDDPMKAWRARQAAIERLERGEPI